MEVVYLCDHCADSTDVVSCVGNVIQRKDIHKPGCKAQYDDGFSPPASLEAYNYTHWPCYKNDICSDIEASECNPEGSLETDIRTIEKQRLQGIPQNQRIRTTLKNSGFSMRHTSGAERWNAAANRDATPHSPKVTASPFPMSNLDAIGDRPLMKKIVEILLRTIVIIYSNPAA